eukprot:CAMPEP_0171628714 /NCGR_PEP_ID=MMETSP0990-20121206/21648_1 /TAXON_ID=483369 /ORGANISM="non described non described, Strain CCMP2098" /LENGTH=241 /DNA_ID=CAMNT_0012197045 /DNA_START=31 /DNA_END=756 /DNA_ORIENTATION=-
MAESSKKRKHCTQPSNIKPSGASIHGLPESQCRSLVSTILSQVNYSSTSHPINWEIVSRQLAESFACPTVWPPLVCQKVWKFIAYGQLFAASSAEVASYHRGELDVRDWLTAVTKGPQSAALPDSDEEDFALSPEDLSFRQVRHRVAIVRKKSAGAALIRAHTEALTAESNSRNPKLSAPTQTSLRPTATLPSVHPSLPVVNGSYPVAGSFSGTPGSLRMPPRHPVAEASSWAPPCSQRGP